MKGLKKDKEKLLTSIILTWMDIGQQSFLTKVMIIWKLDKLLELLVVLWQSVYLKVWLDMFASVSDLDLGFTCRPDLDLFNVILNWFFSSLRFLQILATANKTGLMPAMWKQGNLQIEFAARLSEDMVGRQANLHMGYSRKKSLIRNNDKILL